LRQANKACLGEIWIAHSYSPSINYVRSDVATSSLKSVGMAAFR
jgi:hypothetical protein